jgi:hypothetical protein
MTAPTKPTLDERMRDAQKQLAKLLNQVEYEHRVPTVVHALIEEALTKLIQAREIARS